MAALWHGTYNMVAGTAAGEGAIGTVVTILVMLWAAALVVRARSAAWSSDGGRLGTVSSGGRS